MILITFLILQAFLGALGFFLNPAGALVKIARLGFFILIILVLGALLLGHHDLILKR